MNNENAPHAPLPGDPARQAIPSLRGYAYQIWRTVDRWLRLKPGETLFIECAEDMDIAARDGTTAVQIKSEEKRISLASQDALAAILHFWELKQRSSERIRFQFLTRGAIATEKGDFFNRRAGIDVWRDAVSGNTASCGLIRTFLLDKFAHQSSFTAYLTRCTPEAMIQDLISPLEWVTEEPDTSLIKEFIRRRLIAHGEQLDYTPSVSLRVIDALYSHCWDVAQRNTPQERSLAREDFLALFDKETTVAVPISHLTRAMVPMGGGTVSVSLAMSSRFWTDGAPPLPNPVLPRERAVKAAVATLPENAPLVLAASAGKGKTTLAKLVATAIGKPCLWIDLSGRETGFAEAALAALALALQDRTRSYLVVIDDFLIESSSPAAVWTSLEMLQQACSSSNSALLITTKGIPRDRLDARLISTGASVQQIEDLSAEEIKPFLESLGCPAALSNAWATLTIAQTGGHPKLVHVRALDLRDKGWPTPTSEDLTKTPPSISGQRDNERLNVAERETGPTLEFLYHLTLLTLPFDRQLALRLGSKVEELTDPGTALDRFLGRWIEPAHDTRFRVTSLLTNEAVKVWPLEKLQKAHERLFDSFLENQVIDVTYALSVFTHAYLSASPARVATFLHGILYGADTHFPRVAEELKPILYFGRSIGSRAVPFDPGTSLLFRMLQVRIAAREAPEELSNLVREWLFEIENLPHDYLGNSHDEFVTLSKGLWAGSVASLTEGDLEPATILKAIIMIAHLSGVPALTQVSDNLRREMGTDDALPILFSFFQIRCTSVDYLERLLDALVNVPASLRARMLKATELPYFVDYSFIVESAWSAEIKKETSDWPNVIRVLEKTRSLAKAWDATRLGHSAAKALSIVLDEQLRDRDAAQTALAEGRHLFGDTPFLDEQEANIHYRHHELDAALPIWERALALTEDAGPEKVRDPFAFRKAAIAAGDLGDSGRAAVLFARGGQWAQHFGMKRMASGMRFDAAYAYYNAQKFAEMCRVMEQGVEELIGQPDPEADFNRFALQKLAGYVTLWIRNDVTKDIENEGPIPIIGCCSNPEYDSGLKQLPRSPGEVTVAHVIELEHRLSLPRTAYTTFATDVLASAIPAVEMKLRQIELEQVYRQRNFGGLLPALDALKLAYERGKAQRRTHQDILRPFQGSVEPEDRAELGIEHFLLCALTTQLLSGGSAEELIRAWKESSEKTFSGVHTTAIDKVAKGINEALESPVHILRDKRRDSFLRLAAAHVVLISPVGSPESSIYAEGAYVTWLSQVNARIALQELLPLLSSAYSKAWEHHVESPALLRQPRQTVPAIREALAHLPDGPERIRQLLLAGSAATGIGIPPETLAWLRQIDGESR